MHAILTRTRQTEFHHNIYLSFSATYQFLQCLLCLKVIKKCIWKFYCVSPDEDVETDGDLHRCPKVWGMLQLIEIVIVIINDFSLQCSSLDYTCGAVFPSGLGKSQKWMLPIASASQSKCVSGSSLYKLNEQQAIKPVSTACTFVATACWAYRNLNHTYFCPNIGGRGLMFPLTGSY